MVVDGVVVPLVTMHGPQLVDPDLTLTDVVAGATEVLQVFGRKDAAHLAEIRQLGIVMIHR